jgi:thioredoxin reductase
LKPYTSVRVQNIETRKVTKVASGFEVTMRDDTCHRSRKLLLATGVVDDVPKLTGIEALYGRSVFHCPYCDGWESRDQPVAVYGRTANAVGLAIELKTWSRDLVVCTDGFRLAPKDTRRLEKHGIAFRQQRIERLEGRAGHLRLIRFDDGSSVRRRVMFFSSGQQQGSDLAVQLGCGLTERGAVETGEYEATNIPGLFVAGDASRLVQLAIVAAAEGAQAAFAINQQLTREENDSPRDRPV